MQTRRLHKFLDPKQAQVLLDSYVEKVAKLPSAARKQSDLARLPLAFQDRAEQAESQGLVWSAWVHGEDAWLFVGHMNLNRSRERGLPVLEIFTYDHEHRTKNRTIALRRQDGVWQLLKE